MIGELRRTTGASYGEAVEMGQHMSLFSNIVAIAAPQFTPFDFQSEIVDDYVSRWRIIRKPRQVGISMMFAHDAVGKALAMPNHGALFISLNKDDAQEKIIYAHELHEAIASSMRIPAIVTASKTEIVLENGSRLKAVYYPRGKARMDLYLDEMAHYSNARKIYRAGLPIMSLGGQLIIASTPLHSGTLFNQIWEQDDGRYADFKRMDVRWWDCPIHCNDVVTARLSADSMETEERVARFGTTVLVEIYHNMLLEDFQMEYENKAIDDSASLLSFALIVRQTPTGEDAIRTFDTLEAAMNYADGRLVFGGYDVGRRRDDGEFSLMVLENESGLFERFSMRFEKEEFQVQQDFLDVFCQYHNTRLCIDETGMGMQMAEYLESKHGEHKAVKINFSASMYGKQIKSLLATTIKRYMLSGKAWFGANKRKNLQMHAIKKEVTAAGNIVYRAHLSEEEDDHHHADVFWARALAVFAQAELDLAGARPEVRVMGELTEELIEEEIE